jgi:hypothetical protein
MKHILTFLLLSTLLTNNSLQSQTIKLDSVFANYGDTALVALEFYGYFYVGAISLVVNYDTTALKYTGLTNLIPEGQGTLANATVINSNNVVAISWVATSTGVDIPDGKFMDIKFLFKESASDLVFIEQYCEIVDWEVNPITSLYIDGRVDHIVGVEEKNPSTSTIYSYSDRVVMNTDGMDNPVLNIYDLTGKCVLSDNTIKSSGEIILNYLPSGFYIINVKDNHENFTKKLFIRN